MVPFIVQPAREEHFDAIHALHESAFRPHIEPIWGWDPDWQRTDFARSWTECETDVVHSADALIGYLQVQAFPDHLRLKNIALAPPYQGRGIGSALVRDRQSRARAASQPIHLSVFVTNPAAERWYLRLGFEVTARDTPFVAMTWSPSAVMLPTPSDVVAVAGSEDLDAIRALHAAGGYGGGVSAEDTNVVVHHDGRIVDAVRLCHEHGTRVLRGMQVAEAHRRRGVGSHLLRACEPWLNAAPAYCLPYRHLVAFYQQIGFEPAPSAELPAFLAERLARYHARGSTTMAMRRLPRPIPAASA